MTDPFYSNLLENLASDGFGDWFAGLVAGEGCFQIHTVNGRPGLRCRFSLLMRDDEAETFRMLRERLGIGALIERESKPWRHGQICWEVWRKDECAVLCAVFGRFALRAKKRRDFEIWSEAVRLWNEMDGKRPPGRWAKIEALRAALLDVREYRTAG